MSYTFWEIYTWPFWMWAGSWIILFGIAGVLIALELRDKSRGKTVKTDVAKGGGS